jgi:hypothetical protein
MKMSMYGYMYINQLSILSDLKQSHSLLPWLMVWGVDGTQLGDCHSGSCCCSLTGFRSGVFPKAFSHPGQAHSSNGIWKSYIPFLTLESPWDTSTGTSGQPDSYKKA